MTVVQFKKADPKPPAEPRRGGDPCDTAYLKQVGLRVRTQRRKLGMSRKTLSQMSGVSERYLAELERGSGNASLLVLRSVANAMSLRVDDLAYEDDEGFLETDDGIANVSAGKIGKIVLVGLRGAGKSTLGRAAANRFNVPFVELNDEVERVAGMDVSEIFAEQGEAAYRKLEHTCLEAILQARDNVIVATGGGIASDSEAFQQVVSDAFVIWIRTSPEVLFERARKSMALPNGLTLNAMAEIRSAVETREPSFAKAAATVDTTDKEVMDALEILSRHIRTKNAK